MYIVIPYKNKYVIHTFRRSLYYYTIKDYGKNKFSIFVN